VGTTNFDVDVSKPETLTAIRDYINGLNADGNTAIYSAQSEAYQLATQDYAKEPDRVYSIVLMSDGENNSGISQNEFFNDFKKMKGAESIRTFTILFGEADQKSMQRIADGTGGRLFDASHDPLPFIFKEIRGYQ